MSASRTRFLLFAGTLLLAACGKSPPAPVSAPALTRPVLGVESRSGRLWVAQAALVERGGIPAVFVLSENDRARLRMVRIGRITNGRAEILSGLQAGETLIGGDLRDVYDGSPIRQH